METIKRKRGRPRKEESAKLKENIANDNFEQVIVENNEILESSDNDIYVQVEHRPCEARIIKIPKDKWGVGVDAFVVSIDNQKLVSTMIESEFFTLSKRVFELKESDNGRISAFDKRFDCTDEQALLFNRLLFYCFGAKQIVGENQR